jgi:virginiamycin B lyase
MKLARKPHILVAMILFLVPACYGATISGTVKGPDGAPVSGAFVQAQNSKSKITFMGVSDNQGHYRVEKVPAGEYRVQIRAVGYNFAPQSGVNLTGDQNLSSDFALTKGTVRWNDLSVYQLGVLTPAGAGKQLLFARCFICHAFQTRMASVRRDADGWRDRVQYMQDAMHFNFGSGFTNEQANTVAAYLTSLFGPDSVLAKSPADMPEYKDTLRSSDPKASNIEFVEYDMPGPSRMPFSAAPAKDGSVWIPNFGVGNKITKLDPTTGQMQDFPVPNVGTAAVHSAYPGPDGSVWLAEQGSDKIGKWDPKTQQVTEYQDTYVPGKEGLAAFGEKHTVRVDQQGNVWATGYPLTKFDPETGKFTHFDQVPHLYGIDIDKQGNVWFTKHDTSQIGKVDTKTMKLTLYTPPNHNVPLFGVAPNPDGSMRSYPRRIAIAPDGMVWFGEFNAGYMEKFDPKSETFTEYQLPGPEATPYGVGFDADGKLWYSSYNQDVLGRLDPATGKITEYPFPHSENTIREFFLDPQGRMWYGSPSNNKVGYFYLTGAKGVSSGN